MLPKLAAGAGTLTLSEARAASATLTSRELLQATHANEKPTANIAAANALTATQREFSMPVIVSKTSAGRNAPVAGVLQQASGHRKMRPIAGSFWGAIVVFAPQPVSGGPHSFDKGASTDARVSYA